MPGRKKRGVPEGLWMSCPSCKSTIFRKEAEEKLNVCPQCDYHLPIAARDRIRHLLDADSFEEWATELRSVDPLEFHDRIPYHERLTKEQEKTGLTEAAVIGRGHIRGRPVVLAITDFAFMAGSMGSVVGERLESQVEPETTVSKTR